VVLFRRALGCFSPFSTLLIDVSWSEFCDKKEDSKSCWVAMGGVIVARCCSSEEAVAGWRSDDMAGRGLGEDGEVERRGEGARH
jgi:hypothetical protein